MTRTQFENLPRPDDLWLTSMQEMADELKSLYSRIELEHLPDPDVDQLMESLAHKATAEMEKLSTWNDVEFVSFTYWCCIERAESLSEVTKMAVRNEEERLFRAEAMLRCQVHAAWMQACIKRVEELGGELNL